VGGIVTQKSAPGTLVQIASEAFESVESSDNSSRILTSEIAARLVPSDFAEIVSDDFQIFHATIMRVYDSAGNVIEARVASACSSQC
jgi:molybdopterin biosynthesis enzyme MoaB